MKLDDIDILNKARADYNATRGFLAALKARSYNLGVVIGGTTIVKQDNQQAEVAVLLRGVITDALSKQHELHVTRLMQLGITEFPE